MMRVLSVLTMRSGWRPWFATRVNREDPMPDAVASSTWLHGAGHGLLEKPPKPQRLANIQACPEVLSRVFSEGFVEGVAGSAHGSDGIALAAARQRFSQAPDMDVDRALVDLRRLAPHAVQELRAREHPAGLLQ